MAKPHNGIVKQRRGDELGSPSIQRDATVGCVGSHSLNFGA